MFVFILYSPPSGGDVKNVFNMTLWISFSLLASDARITTMLYDLPVLVSLHLDFHHVVLTAANISHTRLPSCQMGKDKVLLHQTDMYVCYR